MMMVWIRGIVFIGVVVAISIALLFYLRRKVDFRRLQEHNDVAGFIYAVIGILYGVLTAFVVIVVWERYTEIDKTIQDEANTVLEIHRDADAFPADFRDALRGRLRTYVENVVAHETQTPLDRHGSQDVTVALDALWQTYSAFVPQNENDRVWYAEILTRLNGLAGDRELRLSGLRHHLPMIMWIVLVVGGIVTIGFAYFFGTSNAPAHALMIGGLAVTVALSLMLVWSLSHPYSGLSQLDFTPLRYALELLGSR